MKIIYKDEADLRDYLINLKRKYGTDWREWYKKQREDCIYIYLKNGKGVMIEMLERIMEGA